MKALSKVGLLAAAALLATAAVATSAQAVSINPDNTGVGFVSNNSSFTYGVMFWTCDRATANGTIDHAQWGSDRISDLALTFTENCAVAGVGPVEVSCDGTVTLIADPDADDTGTVELNEGFQCVATMSVCTLTFAGPQTTDPRNTFLDEANQVLEADVEVHVTRAGSLWCGPAEGDGALTADYDLTNDSNPPVPVTIDP